MTKREKITADTVLTEEMECAVDDEYRTFMDVGVHVLGRKIKDCDCARIYRYKDDPSNEFTHKPEQTTPTSHVTEEPELKIEVGQRYHSPGGEHCYYPNPYTMEIVEMDADGTGLRYRSWELGEVRTELSYMILTSSIVDDIKSGRLIRLECATEPPEPAPWQVWRDTDGDDGLIVDVEEHMLTMIWSSRQHICTEGREWVKHLTYLGQLDPAEAMQAMVGTLGRGGE